jgi:hypothetical protein
MQLTRQAVWSLRQLLILPFSLCAWHPFTLKMESKVNVTFFNFQVTVLVKAIAKGGDLCRIASEKSSLCCQSFGSRLYRRDQVSLLILRVIIYNSSDMRGILSLCLCTTKLCFKLPADSTFASALQLMWIELTRLNDSQCWDFSNKYKLYINSLYVRSVRAWT